MPSNEFMDLAGLARGFDFSHLGHSPAHFDQQQLEHWQGEAVRHTGRGWVMATG